MGGRPTKLTPEVQEKLVQALQAANTRVAACAHAGISYSVFAKWMRQGKKARSGKFVKFVQAVRDAEARAQLTLVTQLRQLVADDWRGILALLGRRFPKDWAERQQVSTKLSGAVQAEVVVKEVIAHTREEAAALLALIPKDA
jgi:hypothetical protein